MKYNANKNDPSIINVQKLKDNLSYAQMLKIKYECDLLRRSIDEMLYIAPFLFNDNVTAANTSKVDENHNNEIYDEDLNDYDMVFNTYEK